MVLEQHLLVLKQIKNLKTIIENQVVYYKVDMQKTSVFLNKKHHPALHDQKFYSSKESIKSAIERFILFLVMIISSYFDKSTIFRKLDYVPGL